MQNSYNCRNIVTDKYGNNNQAAKPASVLSNSMKMANKPLFLVAAAMLMLIFFIGTAHASLGTPTLSVSPLTMDAGQTTSTATLSWSGGTAPYSVTLTYGPSTTCTSNEVPGFPQNDITGTTTTGTLSLPEGDYYFCSTVTDNTGASASSEFGSTEFVSDPPVTVSNVAASPSSVEEGQNVIITGSANGGLPGYTASVLSSHNGGDYSSNTASCNVSSNALPQSITCNVDTAGDTPGTYTYEVVLTDTLGGTATSSPTGSVTVVQSMSTPSISPSNPTIDSGQSVTFSSTWTGGTPDYTATLYSSPNPTCNTGSTQVQTISSLTSGSASFNPISPTSSTYYCIAVKDSSSVTVYSNTEELTVNSDPTVSITSPTSTQTINGPITISASASGGTGSPSYSWTVPNSSTCPGFTSATTSSFTYTPTGQTTNCKFTVTVTDSATPPETATATTAQITIPSLSITSFSVNRPVIDAGQSETLSAVISGGIAPYTYSISGCGLSYNPSATSSQTLSTTQNVTCTTGQNNVQLTVKDSTTSVETQTSTATITAYATPSATQPVPSNTLLDSGQYVTYTTTVSGGTGSFTVSLYQNGDLTPIETNTITSDGTVSFAAFKPPVGTDSYYVSITDTGTATPYVATSESNTIIVNTTLQKPTISTQNSPLDLGQYGYITCSNCDVSGLNGQPDYTYQWMVGFGSNTPNAIEGNALCGTTATTTECDFNTANLNLQSGNYDVVLQVTDSATTEVTSSSSVQQMVVNPVLEQPVISPPSGITTQGTTLTFSATENGGTQSGGFAYPFLSNTIGYVFVWYINGHQLYCNNGIITCVTSGNVKNYSITFSANNSMVVNSPDNVMVVAFDGSHGVPTNSINTCQPLLNYIGYSLGNNQNGFGNIVYDFCNTQGNLNFSSITEYVRPSISASPIVPHDQNPIFMDNGQHIALTETPSGGAGIYAFEWYLNGASDNYPGTSAISRNTIGEVSNTINFYGNASTQANSIDTINACVTGPYLTCDGQIGTDGVLSPNLNVHVFPVLGTPTISNTLVPSATSLTMDVGQHVRLNASETGGTGNYVYTWYDNGASISSCNSGSVNTYCLFAPSSTQASSSGKVNDITVKATDIGTDKNATPVQQQTSANFAITAFPALGTPTLSPAPVTMDQGQYISLTASETGGTGSSNYKYTWYDGNSPISSCTTATCTYSTTQSTTTGVHEITVKIVDSGTTTPPAEPPANMTSAQDAITVDAPPLVTVSASNKIMDIGQSSTITATATSGTGTFSYSWTNTGTCPGFSNPGSVTTFVYTPTSTTTNCVFTITVTDTGVTSGAIPPATATASTSALTVNPKPSVSVSPASPVIDNGQSIPLTLTVIHGTGPFTYQWYTGTPGGTNTLISGATSLTYSASPTATTSYFAVVTDTGTTTDYVFNSAADSVTVDQTPTLVVSPSSSTEDQGQSIVLTATPSGGTGSFTYQWYNDSTGSGVSIPSATSATYTVNGDKTGPFAYYAVVTDTGVTSTATPHPEIATSNKASVTVDPQLTASLAPSSSTEDQGQSIVLTATPSGGTGSFTYQWYNDSTGSGVSIPSATSATYKVNGDKTGPFAYYAVVTDTGVTPAATPNPETATTNVASVTVATAPTITITPSGAAFDAGQTETYTLTVKNGVGPFTAELYNITGSKSVGSNVVITSPGGSQTVSFITASTGTFTYNGIATDLGTTNPYTFSSASNSIIVNTALVSGSATFTGWMGRGCVDISQCTQPLSSRTTTVMDQKEGVVATVTAPTTGTSPYTYQWLAEAPGQTSYTAAEANTLCGSTAQSLSCDFLSTTSNPVGAYSFEAQTTDSASSNSVVVSNPVTLTLNAAIVSNHITSNALVVDEGQSFALSDILPATGGTPNFNILWNLVNYNTISLGTCGDIGAGPAYNSVCAISTPGPVNLAVGNPVNLVPGTYSFATTIADQSFQSLGFYPYSQYGYPITITINHALTVSVTPSASSMHADQQVTLTNTTTGGTKSYSYQWFYEAPGASSYTKINGATSNDFTFDASTISITKGGTYNFVLQVTDSASNPVTVNSLAVPITVNPMFATQKALLNVNANVINDEDSGFSGYWGLDNFTRHITANQIGLQTYVINFTDNGQTFIPAGAHSPNAGTIQPYNGVTTLQGAQNYTFNATSFVTDNLPVATNGMFIGTLNEQGTVGEIINNTAPTTVSSEMYYIDGYFSNPTNTLGGGTPMDVGSPNWGGYVYKYNYNIYPPQGQEWIDAGNVLQANSGDIVTYQVPTVTMSVPSNVIVDSGQYETYYATVYNGIGPFTLGLYQSGSSTPVETTTLSTDGQATFAPFQPPVGTDTYYVSVEDTGTTLGANGPADYTFNSLTSTITVNPALVVTASANPSSIYADQVSTLSGSTSGTGTPTYTYQWYIATPGTSTYSAISGATTTSYTFNVIKSGYTQGGIYNFELQATDSATTPVTVNSVAVPVTVNAMFATHQLKLFVTANIVNDEDSGFKGYWALDNYLKTIKVWQIGLKEFYVNTSYLGKWNTFTGALSPQNGVTEPYNGNGIMEGGYSGTFNGTFNPGSNPVSTTNAMIGTFNDNGTKADILLGKYGNGQVGDTGAYDYLNNYFPGYTNFNFNDSGNAWGWTYTYSVYPPQGQTWINSGTVNGGHGQGDLITYQVPTVTMSVPSNILLDNGQYETYSATVYNGIGPFTVDLYQEGATPTLIKSNTLTSDGSVNFAAFQPPVGTDTYYVSVTDTGTTPGANGPADYTFVSASNTVVVNATPTVTLGITNATLDSKQTETFNINVKGGTSPFTVELYNITGNKPVGNVIVDSPGGSNSVSFEVHSLVDGSTFTYNAIATDLGTTTPFTFASNSNTMTVNTNMTIPKVAADGKFFDVGQTIDLASIPPAISGGTPPYYYTFVVTNSTTSATYFTCKLDSLSGCSFSLELPGSYFANVLVTDSASTPAVSESVDPANFIVSPDFAHFSDASISASANTVPSGGSLVLTANILGAGGTSPYAYTYKVFDALNNDMVYTTTTNNAMTSNAIDYVPAANGIYYATVTIADNATPSEYIYSTHSNAFLVGSTATPTLVLTPTSPVIDSGQTEVFNIQAFGGVGPFNVELYNITGSKQVGSNVTIPASGGSATVSILSSTSSSVELTYNAIATDATTHIVFNSTKQQITVNPPFSDGIVLSANNLDMGQSLNITETVNGGTSPYSYHYYVYSGSNAPYYASPAENSISTSNTFTYVPTAIGSFTTNVIVTDSASNSETTNSPMESFNVYNAPSISISPSNAVPTSGQSETYTATVSNGIGPFEVELYNQTGSSAIGNFIIPAGSTSNTIAFTVNSPSSGSIISFNAIATDLGTSNPYTFNSASSTITVTPVAPPPAPTTTVTSSGGGGSGGGGGAAPGGGGSSKPTVLPYNATTVHGWKVLNFTQDDSESVMINGHMFDITLNSISPTLVDITVNGYSYTLNVNQPSHLNGLSNYSVELTSISYLPIQHSVTVEIYGPNLLTKTNSTTTTGGKPASNSTKTTVKTTATTTVATTTVPAQNKPTTKPTTTVSAPPASTEELGAGIVVVILLIIAGMYFYMKNGSKKGRR